MMQRQTTHQPSLWRSNSKGGAINRLPTALPPLLLLLLLLLETGVLAEFNYEVEKRVLERIDDYLDGPRIANGITAKFRTNDGFPHNMDARDRDAYLTFEYSLMQEFKFDMLYYGLEDGTFIGHGVGWGTYREPGNEYDVNEPSMRKYFNACVDRETGQPQNCTKDVGIEYIQCIRNCALMKCADEETQVCSDVIPVGATAPPLLLGGNDTDPTLSHCRNKQSVKWCRQYGIDKVAESQRGKLGYVPRTYHCHDAKGKFTQTPGQAVKEGFLEEYGSPNIILGDCEYEDGVTKVERYELGDFVYCRSGICTNAFDGGYRSREYDPRYRTWYTKTKEIQLPNWSEAYPFFSNLDLGITYSHPIYTEDRETGRYIFDGVLAVDYSFAGIGQFLLDGYEDSSTIVVVYEKAEPNYLVASSTGRKSASKVLSGNETMPCPDDTLPDCIVVREKMPGISGYPRDNILLSAYMEQRSKGYPRELLTIKASGEDADEQLYIVQSSFYRPGEELEWIILIISPAGEGSADALTKDNSLFGLVCVVASLGFLMCLAMFVLFFRQRHERAIILADWRFTSAFLLGCAFLNVSSFTLLGENTNALCMARMWSFHFLFAVALSPLFVKVWRMWRMVGSPNRRPTIVNNKAAVLLSLPIVAIQVLILIIFTFADPPQQEEIINIVDGIVTQHVLCSSNTNAFMVVEIIFEAGLVAIGCMLAFVTRNLDTQFGEAKQLMFSMYNIAFIGIITTVIIYTMDIDAIGKIILQSIGVFWGTVFSSAAFVLPRLIKVKEERKFGNSIMRKSKSTGTSGPPRNSKVRFSMDDDKSSAVSDNPGFRSAGGESDNRSQSTDKKSNCKAEKKEKKDSFERKEKKEKAKEDPVPKLPSAQSGGGSSAEFSSSSFIRGTGWSMFEPTDPNAQLGKCDDDNNHNADKDDNVGEAFGGEEGGARDTEYSSESPSPPPGESPDDSNNNKAPPEEKQPSTPGGQKRNSDPVLMATIDESDLSESNQIDQVRGSGNNSSSGGAFNC